MSAIDRERERIKALGIPLPETDEIVYYEIWHRPRVTDGEKPGRWQHRRAPFGPNEIDAALDEARVLAPDQEWVAVEVTTTMRQKVTDR